MVGKFLLGMVAGGLMVTGGLIVGSALFPMQPANDNSSAAAEEPITAPAATEADAGNVAQEAVIESEPAPVEAASGEEAADAPAEDPVVGDTATADAAAETSPETEAAMADPAPASATAGAEVSATTTPVEPASSGTGDETPQPEVAATVAEPEAPKVTVEEAAPAAADVPKPAIMAEPSKPAGTEADVPAVVPEAPAATAVAPEPAQPEVAASEASGMATEEVEVAAIASPDPVPQTGETTAAETEVAGTEADPAPSGNSAITEDAPAADQAADPAVGEEIEPGVVADAAPAPETPAPDTATAETRVVDPAAPAQDTEAVAEEPAPTEAPVVDAPVAEAPVAEPPVAEAPVAEPPVAEAAPEVAQTDPAMPVPDVADDDATPGEAVAEMPGTRPNALPGADDEPQDPAAATEDRASTFTPAPSLPRAGEGTIIGRDQPTDPAATDPAAAPVDPRPLVQFAAAFENPDAKPPFAIVLVDDGSAGLDRAALASLPFPVSFALDPQDPATAQHAATYRAAGKEVVMLVTGIAQGAMPADVEVAFQSMEQGLPEAVAVMDLQDPSFQNRRPLAATVVPILKAQGRGLLTWDAGLNAADQVARREDLEAAVIFRDIGSTGADAAAIRRLLDRAVFKAGQDGRVTVVGQANPATVAALLEWTVEGKAATVALAPVTAVLTVE